jgi:hypothetical protein
MHLPQLKTHEAASPKLGRRLPTGGFAAKDPVHNSGTWPLVCRVLMVSAAPVRFASILLGSRGRPEH